MHYKVVREERSLQLACFEQRENLSTIFTVDHTDFAIYRMRAGVSSASFR